MSLIDKGVVLPSDVPPAEGAEWLLKHGAEALEALLRAVVSDASAPPTEIDSTGDSALCLLDAEGRIVEWRTGATSTYGYESAEVMGRHIDLLSPGDEAKLRHQLHRAAAEGHFGAEDWHVRNDGSRFWANTITLALTNHDGALRGFAMVVRDFTERHDADEKLRRSRARLRPSRLRRLSPASCQVSSIASRKQMMPSLTWCSTAARIFSSAAFRGMPSIHPSTPGWTAWRMRKPCASEAARRTKRNCTAAMERERRCWLRPPS